jgi:hypothetical protein
MARVLWEHTEGRTATGSISLSHVEDAAMFHYEKFAKMTPYSGKMYTTEFGQGTAKEATKLQLPYGSRDRSSRIDPSCFKVLKDLKIRKDGKDP